MRRRRTAAMGEDTRKVAIYTRKSVITNKGDSIGVQLKQSADYAMSQLKLPEDYEFEQYSDKGLSGYYADRPDFQRMLHDIDSGKIRAVACYKLDRISRKTSDLMRLLEYLEKNDVVLLVCSNNINTQISTSKIIIQVLAIIAEFERDILTERIQDNLMELSKDGRWMGGQTPTGFDKQRVATGSGKNKSAVSFLVPIPEQREQVQLIFKKFLETRSYNRTKVYMNENGYVTKNGLPYRMRAISDILHNPVYCTADPTSYQFFFDNGANVAGNIEDFDGKHALSGYNKTDHVKDEHEDSTFFNPKFTQLSFRKPINDWIISVGKHEPFISSEDWIAAQQLMKDIEEQHNRPHRATNALLSGLMICPKCGKVLNVVSESGRWTRGRPRFKYVCPGHRKKECDYLAVDGVKLDDQVVRQLAALVDEQKETYFKLIEARIRELTRSDASEREYQETKKDIEKIKADIAAQIRNLREADDVLRKFIQGDIPKKIRNIRAACGCFMGDFGRLMGFDNAASAISQWEAGNTKPSRKYFYKLRELAVSVGIDMDKLNDDPDFYKDEYAEFIETDCGDKIRYIRLQYGVFMEQFAEMIGTSGNTISEWEAGNCVPMRYWFPEIKKAAANKGIDLNALNGHPEIYKDPFTELIQKQDSEEWVRRIRKQCGLTVDAFARYIGVSRSTVNSWETHQNCRKPSRESFNRIVEMAKMRGVDIYDPWRTETLANPAASERKE